MFKERGGLRENIYLSSFRVQVILMQWFRVDNSLEKHSSKHENAFSFIVLKQSSSAVKSDVSDPR